MLGEMGLAQKKKKLLLPLEKLAKTCLKHLTIDGHMMCLQLSSIRLYVSSIYNLYQLTIVKIMFRHDVLYIYIYYTVYALAAASCDLHVPAHSCHGLRLRLSNCEVLSQVKP